MPENQNQPKQYDAVLGTQSYAPTGSVILGGLEGVKSRLNSSLIESQISALHEALKYGDIGLDLVLNAAKSSEWQLQKAAEKY